MANILAGGLTQVADFDPETTKFIWKQPVFTTETFVSKLEEMLTDEKYA
jgi:hypothetical protein